METPIDPEWSVIGNIGDIDDEGNFEATHTGTGSVIALTNTNQNITDAYTYNAFGNIIERTGNTTNPYTFTARESDSDSGLMYYRARYYSPEVGRFISKDPFAGFAHLPQTLNLYVYVSNNPVNRIDPTGQVPPIIKVIITIIWDKLKELTVEYARGIREGRRTIRESIATLRASIDRRRNMCIADCVRDAVADPCFDREKCLEECTDTFWRETEELVDPLFRDLRR